MSITYLPEWQGNGRLPQDSTQKPNQSPPTEQEILEKIANGEHAHFWELWIQHQPIIYRSLLHWLNYNHQEAEDLLSQIMIKAWRTVPHHSANIKNFKAWLIIFSRNYCLDKFRKEKRDDTEVVNLDKINQSDTGLHTKENELPENALLKEELTHFIIQLIDEFPHKLKETVRYRLMDELPYRDIAQKVGVTPENARKIHQKGRKILQREVTHYLATKQNRPNFHNGR